MAQTKIEQGLLKFTEATDYLKIPTGTTAQRPSSPANGYIRFNTTINDVEAYNGTEWTRMGIAPPTFTSVDYPGSATALNPDGGESLVINGTNFNTGITITIDGTTPSSITRNSDTQLTVTAPAKAAGTYNIVFTNSDGGTATAINAVSYNGVPSWTTAAGNLGSVNEAASISFTVTATEPDGGAITYAITSGALPSGASLNTSTGAITGTAGAVNANTTYTFTITATDNENQTAAREFNIIVLKDGPSNHFNIATWAGDGTTNRNISAGFEPALIITKKRSTTSSWYVLDSIRGNGRYIYLDTTGTDDYNINHGKLTSTGLNTSGGLALNTSGVNYISYFWKGSGSTSTNTNGSITATIDANPNKGFSIVTWTGNSSNATIGHGLSSAPEMIIAKSRTVAQNWAVYHKDVGPTYWLRTNGNQAKQDEAIWQDTTPTSSVFSVNGNTVINSGNSVAYCFHSVNGFSKFGSYTGNGSTNGPIIQTGFEPAFLLIKRTDAIGDWRILDNKRNLTNPRNSTLKPNSSEIELTGDNEKVDFLSNGFQIKSSHSGRNANGGTYIYMAFAADPDTTAPTLADSFNTVTYSGNGSTQSITGLGFQPNLVWIKARNQSYNNQLHDSMRGAGDALYSDLTSAGGYIGTVSSFGTDGFTVDGTTYAGTNGSGATFVAWAWKADDNEPTINTDGGINSLVSANSNAGFSIVKYAGNGTAGTTIGHGLSSTPEFLIVKCISGTDSGSTSWHVYTPTTGATKTINLNSDAAASTNSLIWNNTAPTSTVFSVANNTETNNTGRTYIAYCFHSVSGFSKIGSYTGNGNSSGPTVTTGFQPDWIMIKNTSAIAAWMIIDSVRGTSLLLQPQSSAVEENVGTPINFTSTGFQITDTNASRNRSGDTYIYMAFKIN